MELPTYPIPVELSDLVPRGMVCFSAPGSDVVYFGWPGSIYISEYGELDVDLVPEPPLP